MTDTIELLEAIGSDASLRYASAGSLAGVLEESRASAALISAVAAGDSAVLAGEFGSKLYYSTESNQCPGPDEGEEEPGDDPTPEDDPSLHLT